MSTALSTTPLVITLPHGTTLNTARTETLLKNRNVEVIHLVVLEGCETMLHHASCDILVQCLEGRAGVTVTNAAHELDAGCFLFVEGGQPHTMRGFTDTALLMTLITGSATECEVDYDPVQEAGEESFPASDSPAISRAGKPR